MSVTVLQSVFVLQSVTALQFVTVPAVLQSVLHLVLVSTGVPPAHLLSRMMGALRLDGESSRDQQGESPVWMVQSEAARDRHTAGSVVLVPGSGQAAGLHPDHGTQRLQSEQAAGVDHIKVRRTTGSR